MPPSSRQEKLRSSIPRAKANLLRQIANARRGFQNNAAIMVVKPEAWMSNGHSWQQTTIKGRKETDAEETLLLVWLLVRHSIVGFGQAREIFMAPRLRSRSQKAGRCAPAGREDMESRSEWVGLFEPGSPGQTGGFKPVSPGQCGGVEDRLQNMEMEQSREGSYDADIDSVVQILINDMEAELLHKHLANPCNRGSVNHYWQVKNLFARYVMHYRASWMTGRLVAEAVNHGFQLMRVGVCLVDEQEDWVYGAIGLDPFDILEKASFTTTQRPLEAGPSLPAKRAHAPGWQSSPHGLKCVRKPSKDVVQDQALESDQADAEPLHDATL